MTTHKATEKAKDIKAKNEVEFERGASGIFMIERKIEDKIAEILKRYEESDRIRIPREGAERTIRGWLMCELFHNILGWKMEKIILGERFDLSLYDDFGHVVIYVETKSPAREIYKKDREDFFGRTKPYGTIRYAIITNGYVWERYNVTRGIVCMKDKMEIFFSSRERSPEKKISEFFKPLRALFYSLNAE